ncbi:MAG: Phenylacetic acid catabolic protein, partial [Candidatus Binatia bacterium]
TSYGPYSRAMLRICSEENAHKRQGHDILSVLARGSPEQRRMAQDAVDRWWWPTLMMFGPPDEESPNTAELMRWKVKPKSNDELRSRFIDLAVPQAKAMGLTLPDPDLRFDEQSGRWRTGPIDWQEFWRVVRGGGPCNRERLEARRTAHEGGRWVRAAAEAYEAKRRARLETGATK